MKITIVCAGKLKEKYLRDGIAEYEKRIRPYADLRTIEIIEERMKDRPSPAEKDEVLYSGCGHEYNMHLQIQIQRVFPSPVQ